MIMAITLLFSSPVTVECLPVPHPRFLLRSQLLNRPYALLVGKAISAFRPYWKAWRSMELSERPSSSDKDCRTHYSFTRSEKINPEGWR
jgi:hypothetical protein